MGLVNVATKAGVEAFVGTQNSQSRRDAYVDFVAFLLAFIISLDDFIITNFVKGAGMETLPTAIFGSVKQGIKPNIMAISTMMLAVSILFVTLSYFVNRIGQRTRS